MTTKFVYSVHELGYAADAKQMKSCKGNEVYSKMGNKNHRGR